MKHRILAGAVFAGALVVAFHAAGQGAAQRAIQLPEILAWKRIQAPLVSNDGQWLAYKLVPNEGDAELVVRNLKDGSEHRYPIGEQPRPDPNAGPQQRQAPMGAQATPNIAFSADSRWLAVLAFPGSKEAKMLKGQGGPMQTRVMLLELATGNRVDFPRTRRFAFSGEKSQVIALQRAPSMSMAAGGAMPQMAAAQAAGAQVAVRRVAVPQGATGQGENPAMGGGSPPSSDLVLRNLATGVALNIGNVSEFAFDKQGNWLAWTVSAEGRVGNGIVLRNLVTGTVIPLESGPAIYRALNWTEKGDGLTALKGMDARRWQGQVFALIAFKGFSQDSAPTKIVYEPMTDNSFPAGMAISPTRMPAWNQDLSAISFGIHELSPRKMGAGNPNGPGPGGEQQEAAGPMGMGMPEATAEDDSTPSLVLWHWKDTRLQSMQQVQEMADRNFAYLAEYRPAEQKFIRLADAEVRRANVAPDHKFAVGIDVRSYELESSLNGQRFEDIYAIDLKTGQRKLALKKARWVLSNSPATELTCSTTTTARFTPTT